MPIQYLGVLAAPCSCWRLLFSFSFFGIWQRIAQYFAAGSFCTVFYFLFFQESREQLPDAVHLTAVVGTGPAAVGSGAGVEKSVVAGSESYAECGVGEVCACVRHASGPSLVCVAKDS